MVEMTREFLKKEPNDEEMMAFLEKNIKERYILDDDILSIIEMLKDEKNKHNAICKYVVNSVLTQNMERVFTIIRNIKDQDISEKAEGVILRRLEQLQEDNIKNNEKAYNYYYKEISHVIMGYITGLEDIGRRDNNPEYFDRAKGLLEDCFDMKMITERDLRTRLLFEEDFSIWNRQELEKFERFLKPEDYNDLIEKWEEETQEKETKNLINGVIQEANQQKISLEELTMEFLKAVAKEGVNTDCLYKWILESDVFKLLSEQREELSTGEKEINGLNVNEQTKED